ncbi:MAG: DUF309 domain-containing protein, partial [Pseudonocardia sp.]|nr:DUF309 domain-containing protein [Pseudonocardia sp.]
FQAHEVLEGTWKATTGAERALWQGLAQLAVGLTHAQRGNATGAAALLERGAERIAPFAAEAPHGLDVSGLVARVSELAGRIRAGGLAAVTEADRRIRLLPSVQDADHTGDQDGQPRAFDRRDTGW